MTVKEEVIKVLEYYNITGGATPEEIHKYIEKNGYSCHVKTVKILLTKNSQEFICRIGENGEKLYTTHKMASKRRFSSEPKQEKKDQTEEEVPKIVKKRGRPPKVKNVEEEEEVEKLYCICRKPYDENTSGKMIECTNCKEWFHLDCIGMSEKQFKEMKNEKYSCETCTKKEKKISKEPLFCLCRKPYKKPYIDDPMIECHQCSEWYHIGCIGMSEEELKKLKNKNYTCKKCIDTDKVVNVERVEKTVEKKVEVPTEKKVAKKEPRKQEEKKVEKKEEFEGEELFCSCKKPFRKPWNGKMIQCDQCEIWYHLKCINMSDQTFNELKNKKYICNCCETDQKKKKLPQKEPRKKLINAIKEQEKEEIEEEEEPNKYIKKKRKRQMKRKNKKSRKRKKKKEDSDEEKEEDQEEEKEEDQENEEDQEESEEEKPQVKTNSRKRVKKELCICDDQSSKVDMIQCDGCDIWYHKNCINMTDEDYEIYNERDLDYHCKKCNHKQTCDICKKDSKGEDHKHLLKCDDCKKWFHYHCLNLTEEEYHTNSLLKHFSCPPCLSTLYCICQMPYVEKYKRTMIECDKCHEWYHIDCIQMTRKQYNQYVHPQHGKPFECNQCLGKEFPPKRIFERKSHFRFGTSDEIDRSKRVAPGGNISRNNIKESPRKGESSKNMKEIRETKFEIQEEKKEKVNQIKKENQSIRIKLGELKETEKKEEPQQQGLLKEEVMKEVYRLEGKQKISASRRYLSNEEPIPENIQHFIDIEFKESIQCPKYKIEDFEFISEFDITEKNDYPFLKQHSDYILFGWGANHMICARQFDQNQDLSNFNIYILSEEKKTIGPIKLSDFLKECK